ncbi:Beta-glucuronidase [Tolypocladium paradoxum]|uniref:Beta-glucuronidase n=1 Tax=Tolypocladium paradoxum TaxID=94208 RepID=A0A2S4L8U7_9HYPO|nr:Beta-glucuronidase [Tolypocladium paradoxum]
MLSRGGLLALVGAASSVAASTYKVPSKPGIGGEPFDGFVSYSIEFSSFPDFAGNRSNPNTFSYNLINNLGALGGTRPYIRVGGNTQDYALYNASQEPALVGVVDPSRSPDYPTTIHIGRAYFESYRTWPGVRFSNGLNMGLGGTRPAGWQTLVDTVPLACEALGGRLYTWAYGNEPDLFSTSAQGPVRPPAWDEGAYVWQWLNATAEIRRQVDRFCPEMGPPRFMAPSFAGVDNRLSARKTWEAGLDQNEDIEFFSTHNYISGATSPGVTLQGTLMNHAVTTQSVDRHTAEYASIFPDAPDSAPPLIFGETNSLYNQGKPGLSNTFGAALWGVDFNLYSASVGVRRVHMHQGTNYRYQAWQPISTDKGSVGTKAPYYGSIAVAAMVAPSNKHPVRISSIPLSSDVHEAAYAAHSSGQLARIAVINMHAYNTTVDGAGLEPLPSPDARRSRRYTFAVEGVRDGQTVRVQRLLANGSDAITGITYDGWSYNWDLDRGKPVRLHNVTVGETMRVQKGEVSVQVPDSSAVLLTFGQS